MLGATAVKKRLMGHRHSASLSDIPTDAYLANGGQPMTPPPDAGSFGGLVFEEVAEPCAADRRDPTAQFSEEYLQFKSLSNRVSLELTALADTSATDAALDPDLSDWVFCERDDDTESEASVGSPTRTELTVSAGSANESGGSGQLGSSSESRSRSRSKSKAKSKKKVVEKELDLMGTYQHFHHDFMEKADFLECFFGPVSWSGMKYAKRWVVLEESAVIAYLPAVAEQKKKLFARWRKQSPEEEEQARKEAEALEDLAVESFQYEVIDLAGCTVDQAKKETGKKISFKIERPSDNPDTPAETFFFKPPSMEENNRWIASVQKNIAYCSTAMAEERREKLIRLHEYGESASCSHDVDNPLSRKKSFVIERAGEGEGEGEGEAEEVDGDSGLEGHTHDHSLLTSLNEKKETLVVEDLQGSSAIRTEPEVEEVMSGNDIRKLDRQLKKQLTKHPEDAQRIITDFLRMVLVFSSHPIGKVYFNFVNDWKEKHYFNVYTVTSDDVLHQSVAHITTFMKEVVAELLCYYKELRAFQKSALYCYSVVEQQLFAELYKFIFLMYKRLYEPQNLATLSKAVEYGSITPAHLGLPRKFWLLEEVTAEGLPYQRAVTLLKTLPDLMGPSEKLELLVSVGKCICDCVSVYYRRVADADKDSLIIGGDDMLPLYAYVVVKAHVPNPQSEVHFIRDFMSQKHRNTEADYFFVTFQTALSLIACLTVETLDNWTKLGLENDEVAGTDHNRRWEEQILGKSLDSDSGIESASDVGSAGMVKGPSTHSFHSLSSDGRDSNGRVNSFGVEDDITGGDLVSLPTVALEDVSDTFADFSEIPASADLYSPGPDGSLADISTKPLPFRQPFLAQLKVGHSGDSLQRGESSVEDVDLEEEFDDEEEEEDTQVYAKVARRPRSISACSDSSLQDIDLSFDTTAPQPEEEDQEVSYMEDGNLDSFVDDFQETGKRDKIMFWARNLIKKGDP